jgi:hypothetical protein
MFYLFKVEPQNFSINRYVNDHSSSSHNFFGEKKGIPKKKLSMKNYT